MSIYGNMIGGGGSGLGKTLVFEDEAGNSFTGVVTEKVQMFDATDNDVREGKTYVSDLGISTGTKVIPSYHTTETTKYVPTGSDVTIYLPNLEKYDYTKLQVIICEFNTSLSDSVSAIKTVILDKVYDVNSTTEIASVEKDSINQTINLGITNDTDKPFVVRCFTYKEID